MRIIFLLAFSLPGLIMASSFKKGLYVNQLPDLLRSESATHEFIDFVKLHQFNHLVLYDLHKVLRDENMSEQLAKFIPLLRNNGVQKISAAGETASSFKTYVLPWHLSMPPEARFDDLYLEFEFWRASEAQEGEMYHTYLDEAGLPKDTSGLFSFFQTQLTAIHQLARQHGLTNSTYVGWFNAGQARFIADHADDIWVHAYNPHTERLFGYTRSRLQMLADAGAAQRSFPIFSAEDEFSGPVLKNTTEAGIFSDYKLKAAQENQSALFGAGYMWFARTHLQQAIKTTLVRQTVL